MKSYYKKEYSKWRYMNTDLVSDAEYDKWVYNINDDEYYFFESINIQCKDRLEKAIDLRLRFFRKAKKKGRMEQLKKKYHPSQNINFEYYKEFLKNKNK